MDFYLFPKMTSNSGPSPFVASASSEFSGSFQAWNAFDGVNNANFGGFGWISNTWSSPQTLQLDLGSAFVCTRYIINPSGWGGIGGDPNMTAWEFQGSNDASSWTTLDSQSGAPLGSFNTLYVVDLVNLTAYRYYRLYITAIGSGANYASVAQVWLRITPPASGSTIIVEDE